MEESVMEGFKKTGKRMYGKIPCSILRSGTSKGLFFLEKDLPRDHAERDSVLLKIMGSPDPKQINGLGGASSVTSKVAIISVSERQDADVDYTFAQVSVDKPIVSYKGNCGNISAGVGPFAIERGLVPIKEPVTSVRIFNTNTEKVIVADVEVKDGRVNWDGDFSIAGVPGTGAPIRLRFADPAGAVTGRLLPTGNAVDTLEVDGFGNVQVSIVDAANPLVFVNARDIGLTGTELPADIDGDAKMLDLLEKIRGAAAVKLGFIDDYRDSAWKTPGVPKMTFVAPPAGCGTVSGGHVEAGEVDLLSRMMSMQKTHPSYAMTGAMCTAAAAVIPGSIVNQVIRPGFDAQDIRIGHPGGILDAGVEYECGGGETRVREAFGFRTARLLMDGAAAV